MSGGTIVLWPINRGGLRGPGAEVITAGCGHESLIGPASLDMLDKDPTLTTVCQDCMKAPKDQKFVVTAEQRLEVIKMVGSEAEADRIIAIGLAEYEKAREQ